jgi:hypothetical protein
VVLVPSIVCLQQHPNAGLFVWFGRGWLYLSWLVSYCVGGLSGLCCCCGLQPRLFGGTHPYQEWAVVDYASRSHNGVTKNDSTEVWLAACCAALCG